MFAIFCRTVEKYNWRLLPKTRPHLTNCFPIATTLMTMEPLLVIGSTLLKIIFGPAHHQHMFWTFGSLAPAASSLADICRVISFAVKTRVMGHFVEFNCGGRIQCVVSEWFACTDSANLLWKRQFLGGRLETEIVYFVNVIDAKLQKAATILLAGPPSLGSAESTNPSLWTSCQCENKCSRKMLLFGRREGFEKLLLLGPTFLLLRPKSWSVRP